MFDVKITFGKNTLANVHVSASCGGSTPCKAGCSTHPRQVVKTLDFTDLQDEVMEHWNNEGVAYQDQDCVTTDPHPIYQNCMKPEFEAILDDPMECINALGYDSLADYLADQAIEDPIQPAGKTRLIFSGVLNKRFREALC